MLDRPAHQAAPERHDVAHHLLSVPLPGEDRRHGLALVVGSVDGQVVVVHHGPQAVGDRFEHVLLVERGEQALVDLQQSPLGLRLPRQFGRLAFQSGVGPGVGDRLRGIAGEDEHRLQVVGAELVLAQLGEADDPDRAALEEHRDHEHRLLDVIGAFDGVPALVVESVVDEQRLAVLRDPSGERALADRDLESLAEIALAEQPIGVRHRLAEARIPVDRVDPDVVIGGQCACLGHDRVGDGLHIGQSIQSGGKILDGPHASGLVGDRPIQARIADGDGCLVGEGLGKRELVIRPFTVMRVVETDHPQGSVVADQRHQAGGLDSFATVRGLHAPEPVTRI